MNEQIEAKKQEVKEAKEKMDLTEAKHLSDVQLVKEIEDCGGCSSFKNRSLQNYWDACAVYHKLESEQSAFEKGG
jgi:hypothetical protein